MPMRSISTEGTIGAKRGEAVVCIPSLGSSEQLGECLRRLVPRTPSFVSLLVCVQEGVAVDPHELAQIADTAKDGTHQVLQLRQPATVDPAAIIDSALANSAPADVVLLHPDCLVSDGWLQGLREAAYCDSAVATVSALMLPDLGLAPSDVGDAVETGFEPLAAAVRAASARIRPRVLTASRDCLYVRRTAVELVSGVGSAWTCDTANAHFSKRCVGIGMCHLIADDVVVARSSSERSGADRRIVIMTDSEARSLSAARRATRRLSVVIDARILGGEITGTQIHVRELVAALARTGKASIRAVVAPELESHARHVLSLLPGVEVVTEAGIAPGDIVHRPFQVSGPRDLPTLRTMGERLVVTNQDLIGYRNPTYFASAQDWDGYRRLTRRALAVADHVVFPSTHALVDAVADDLVDARRTSVVPIGVDHKLDPGSRAPAMPSALTGVADSEEMILCLGSDLRHKNRVFALRTVEQLILRHGWQGYLVLAGKHMARGSSAAEEARLIAGSPPLVGRTIDAGAVTDEEKAWLLERARLVLYPTIYEGFGLVPFEAAERGVPCMWAPSTSLRELLPESLAAIVPWDAEATSDRAFELMRVRSAAECNVAGVRAAGVRLTWDATAERLIEIYQATCDQPPSPAGTLERMRPEASVSEDGLRLVGPDGALAPQFERPLLALATHPGLGEPVFGAIKAGYRVARFVQRMTRPFPRSS